MDSVMDPIQSNQIGVLAEKLNTALKILTGNGDPTNGLVVRFVDMAKTVEDFKRSNERDISELRKDMQNQVVDLRREIGEIKTLIEDFRQERIAESNRIKQEQKEWRNFVIPVLVNLFSAAIGAVVTLVLSGRIILR